MKKKNKKCLLRAKKLSRVEYNDIMKKKMEEMREMYGGRGRGRN